MVKHKRSREEVETYDSDGGFVSDDDGNAPKSKKTKKEKAGGSKGKTGGDDQFWTLSSGRNPKRVTLSEFKGMKMVGIREFYEKDDEYLPGKKGISLTIDQYKALLKAIPEINSGLKKEGIDVGEAATPEDDESEDDPKPQKKKAGKKGKSNIEETSDEEEE